MKTFKQAVAFLLVVCMLVTGNMSLFANAAESDSTSETVSEIGTDMFYRVFHLDAARKYFTKDEIIQLIDIAAEGGYNQFELYLADNQGFRLALDDMTITTEYGNYDLTDSLGAGYSAGSHYTDGVNYWLTQDEMDEIIAHANSKGIGIVPCINAPGHMGAILENFSEFWYTSTTTGKTSQSALDVTNEEAYAFGQAIVKKYAEYFASRGVKYLNIGADEYGADLLEDGAGTNNGMDLLYNEGNYLYFVDFVNEAATIIKDLGMIPRAYNDCIYYNNTDVYNEGEYADTDTQVKFDHDIEICYWNGGWSWGNWFRRAEAIFLAGKGFKMINTNGDYYHVLGSSTQQEDETSVLGFEIDEFHRFATTADPSTSVTIANPAGAMFCIWCDDARNTGGGDNTGDAKWVIDTTRATIIAFGENVLSQQPANKKTVDLEVGETYTETVKGEPNTAYVSMDASIATGTVTTNPGDKEVGGLVEGTVTSGEYYLGYDGRYLGVNDNGDPELVEASEAIPWTISIDSTGAATITQGEYYLDCYYHDTYYYLQCVVTKTPQNEYDYKFDDDNKLYVTYSNWYLDWYESGTDKWLTASSSPSAYFQPYEVVDPTTTTITFEGQKAGTTYAYIGDAEYTINVTSDVVEPEDPVIPEITTEVIEVKVGETKVVTVSGDVTGDYETADTTIATVGTSLDDGKIVGDKVTTTLTDVEYYLGNGTEYLIEKDGTWAMVNAAEAKPWTITLDSTTGQAVIKQGEYFLSSIPNGTTFDVKILTTSPEYPFYIDPSVDNAIYLKYTYNGVEENYYIYWNTENENNKFLGARRTTELDLFSPYKVNTIETPATNLIFEGKQVGQTEVTIDNVRYQINVTTDVEYDEEVNVKAGESYLWPEFITGDFIGTHDTDDTSIATVTTSQGSYEIVYSVGDAVTDTMTAGTYYLGNGSGVYLNIENGSAQLVSVSAAKPWTITISDDVATLKQGDYYLSNAYVSAYSFNLKVSESADAYYEYKFDNANANGIYLTFSSANYYLNYASWGGLGANTDAQATAFRPYTAVATKHTTETALTFHGHKVGTTYVTINDVTYKINVTMAEKVIDLIVGQSETVKVNGNLVGTYTPDDKTIATATTTLGVGKIVGSEYTGTMTSGEYYIGAQGQFVIVENGKFVMVSADEAIPWTVEIDSTGAAFIKQGEYYLSNAAGESGGYIIQPLKTKPTYTMRFDDTNDLYIVNPSTGVWDFVRWVPNTSYANGGYVGAQANGGDTSIIPEYFGPYSVNASTSHVTSITFSGKKVGTTYVTIGDVKYTINVAANPDIKKEEIILEVNQVLDVKLEGDLSGVYPTDDASISTVTATLIEGDTTEIVGTLATGTITDGEYYIGNGTLFLNVHEDTWEMVEKDDAIPWKVTTTASGVVLQQGDYYLSNYISTEDSLPYCYISTLGAALAYNFDSDNENALYFSFTDSESNTSNLYTYWYTGDDGSWVGASTYDASASFKPYHVYSVTTDETILSFYGYKEGTTSVIIGDTEYTITVLPEEETEIELTIPVGGQVVYKQTEDLEGITVSDDYVDVDLLYRRQDTYNWVSNPQAGLTYYIMGVEQHYLAIENGKFVTVENPNLNHKWTVIAKEDGYSLKYGDYYLVNHWHDGVMTLEFLEEDTSVFPWQFDQNRGIYCTDKVESYRLAHNPDTHEWELNDKTTRRIGFAEVTINEDTYATEITFTGKEVGSTEITLGSKTYKITVTEAEAPDITEVSLEYWITNNRCVDINDTTKDRYNVSYDQVNTEAGALIVDLVAPITARLEQNSLEIQTETLVYWRSSINAEGYKQEEGYESRATSGVYFDRIRFWHGQWAVSGDGIAWRVLEDTDQLVAYYIQKTDVTNEVTTYAMDWGILDGINNYEAYKWNYDYSYVLLDFAVKYESGTRTPDEFPLDKTLAYHCTHEGVTGAVLEDEDGIFYRKLGVIQAESTKEYEVYMITLTPHTDDKTSMLSDFATNPSVITDGSLGTTGYSYDGTEKVVWVDDEQNLGEFADANLHAEGYSVGGTARVPEITIYEHQAMLVTYYVRAVEIESAIEVHYHDASGLDTTDLVALKGAPEFYMYNIAVKGDTTFSADIDIDANGNLVNASVTNSLDKTETVNTDLSAMPAMPIQYRYGTYEFVAVSLSEDQKVLHLYYKSNDPIYVVDFGLSVNVDLELTENATAVIQAQPTFGTVVIENGELIYTPAKVLKTIDSVVVKITESGSTDGALRTYKFYPATTVYYEEGFISIKDSGWNEAGSAVSDTNNQAHTLLGEEDFNYGYDVHYSSQQTGPSNGTYIESTAPSGYAEFTFTGTGVDIYANTKVDSGSINILVRNSAGKLVKMLQVNTQMVGTGSATEGQNVTAYNIPVAAIDFGTTHDTYTVQIRHINTRVDGVTVSNPVQIDGFRVYNTLQDSKVFKEDGESTPTFVEMRDMIFGGFGIDSIKAAIEAEGSDYISAEDLAGALKSQVLDATQNGTGIVSEDGKAIVIDNKDHDNTYVQDLLDNGPKNEVYLFAGQSIVFKPVAGIDVQLGLKAINANVSYTIVKSADGTEISNEAKAITTSTDMFYQLGTMDGNTVVTITNTSEDGGILSITDFKWMMSDATAEALAMPLLDLEEDDYASAFESMGYESENPPEVSTDTILYQMNRNTSDVRLIAYVDDLEAYSSVSFTLTIGGNTSKELVCTTAYSGLYADGTRYATEDIYGEGGYFATYIIRDYLEYYAGQEVTITATYTTINGENIVNTRTVTIQ